ncbi:MAG: aldolase [Roseicyclus sp.]|nr:aldolase [Roseicyclus sp.]MBO6625933.1 aldolase [Roseicyclus sp.]MBO6923613.1 aldolase [Roseicyclus sp.]
MAPASFKSRLVSGEILAGTFMKTPAVDVMEVLMLSGLDFVCIDQEHAPFDRGSLGNCLAVARAGGFPVLVRVASSAPEHILQALDAGAVGVVVPHVMTGTGAAKIAKAARFGHGGRGYAGSSRWAGYGTGSMAGLLSRSAAETVVIAQIEDPEAVDCADDIAATEGIDAVFLGPADLSVAYGKTDQDSAELRAAFETVGRAARAAGKGYMTFVADAAQAARLRADGVSGFFIASEHAWILAGARAAMAGLKDMQEGE